jgi:hypothetical protein
VTRRTWLCPGCDATMVTGDRHGNAAYCSHFCADRASRQVRWESLMRLKRQFPEAFREIREQVWAERRAGKR